MRGESRARGAVVLYRRREVLVELPEGLKGKAHHHMARAAGTNRGCGETGVGWSRKGFVCWAALSCWRPKAASKGLIGFLLTSCNHCVWSISRASPKHNPSNLGGPSGRASCGAGPDQPPEGPRGSEKVRSQRKGHVDTCLLLKSP